MGTYHSKSPSIGAYYPRVLTREHGDRETPEGEGKDHLGAVEPEFDGRDVVLIPFPGYHGDGRIC